MAPRLHEIYSSELSKFDRGHPIAVPHPGYMNGQASRMVSIGDVGYIRGIGGDFVRLFNVHLEPGHDGQPSKLDLPGDFEKLPIRDVTTTPCHQQIWLSKGVSHKDISAEVSGTPFAGGSVHFDSSHEQGAVLATPDPIEWSDALHILSYKEYTKNRVEGWHEFARARGHNIELEDLILVTGVDHTTSWANAAFSDSKFGAGVSIEVQFADFGTGKLACNYSWKGISSGFSNWGPGPAGLGDPHAASASSTRVSSSPAAQSYVVVVSRATDSLATAQTEPQPINTVKNQSLFIRHMRAKRRTLWRGIEIKAAGESDSKDGSRKGSDEDPSATGLVVASYPERHQFIDCLDPVLDYVFEHSNATLAIAHDEDIGLLLPSGTEYKPYITVQDGIGVFRSGHTAACSPWLEPHEGSHNQLAAQRHTVLVPSTGASAAEGGIHHLRLHSSHSQSAEPQASNTSNEPVRQADVDLISSQTSPTGRFHKDYSRSDFDTLWNEALRSYKEETGKELLELPFANQLLSRSYSTDEIVQYIAKQNEAFEGFRASGMTVLDKVKSIVHVVQLFIDAGAEGDSKVVPGVKVIFVAISALLQAAKGISALYNAIESLLRKVSACLARTEVYLEPSVPPNTMLLDVPHLALVQAFVVLGIVTKYCDKVGGKDSKSKGKIGVRAIMQRMTDYSRVFQGEKEIDDALKELEELTIKGLIAAVKANTVVRSR